MEITIIDVSYVINPHARGGIPPSYVSVKLDIIANSEEEVRSLIRSMQQWSNGTFQPVVLTSQEPDLVVPQSEQIKENIDIDPMTGYPR